VPISVVNYQHYGTWLPVEINGIAAIGKFHLDPFWGFIGNLLCIPLQNLVPPFYNLMPPFYSEWPMLWHEMVAHFLNTSLGAHFGSFERFAYLSVAYYHGISEANAGLGFGVAVTILATIFEIRRIKRNSELLASASKSLSDFRLLRLAPWALLAVFMAKNGALENARHLAPYYFFLFPVWLVRPGHSPVTRLRSWQHLVLQVMAITPFLVATISERPLFPAQTFLRWIQPRFPHCDLLVEERAHYLERNLPIEAGRREFLKQALPPDEIVVGYFDRVCFMDEPSLWLPYGRRHVECLLPDDPPERLRMLGIHYVVLNGFAVSKSWGKIDKWLDHYNATLINQYTFPRMSGKPEDMPDLYVARLN